MVDPTIPIVFVAGFLSFISPCVLPLIPGFLGYLAGTHTGEKGARMKLFLNSVFFVLGFSVVFAALGVLLETTLQNSSATVLAWLSRIGGIVIILFALYLLDIIHLEFLQKEYKLTPKKKFKISYVSSFVFGTAFAVGWTPCVGAVLGSVLAITISKPGLAFALLVAYSLGLGIPFLVVGLFTDKALVWINKSQKVLKYFNIVVGILLLIIGILVFTNKLNLVANFFVPASLLP